MGSSRSSPGDPGIQMSLEKYMINKYFLGPTVCQALCQIQHLGQCPAYKDGGAEGLGHSVRR